MELLFHPYQSRVNVLIDENEADVENKLRQTTLSQAFKNEQQTDSDLQQSLKEFSKGNQQDKTSIESKENRPPLLDLNFHLFCHGYSYSPLSDL
jgi:hypothetical protein